MAGSGGASIAPVIGRGVGFDSGVRSLLATTLAGTSAWSTEPAEKQAAEKAAESAAQQAADFPEMPAPRKEHQWLARFVGEWESTVEVTPVPDQPPMKSTGTESVRSLGGLWTLGEGRGEMPGGGVGTTLMTLGYDPARGRFVGTFVGSMMTLFGTDGSTRIFGVVLVVLFLPGLVALYRWAHPRH